MIVEPLKIFVTVAEQSNFSRAAQLLHLSQPGVSLHIRNLENELGVRLLHRSPKQVKLTEAGTVLYERAKQILSLYEDAKQEIHLLRDTVTGTLNIGASFTIGEYVLPGLIAEFANQYPQVDIRVSIGNTEETEQAVRENALDFGLVEGGVLHPDVLMEPFMEDEMVVIAPPDHPLSSMKNAGVDSLDEQVWVFRENGSGTRSFSDRLIQSAALHIKRAYVFNSSQGVKEAVAAGLGIAVLSRWVVRKDIDRGELIEVNLKETDLNREFSIIQRKDSAATKAAGMFIQKLHLISAES
ncbi:selenium metabolism-associated LysR family transcriptional regulator [Paenibacillus alkalitolerans]|uniref:selenium metabolism-associated LysR family transcriptional regulator n=1 Tax=Paenibacillus alkalitolerans TaxID=2799335 RepID=UPI0018F7BA1D|nr:selenium metabolism-associated LysR family transcriptional regulator [Paenibacillus alkalitolerans]